MNIRNIVSEDYARLGDVVNEWGNRSNIYQIVPRLFFEHFQPTSFVMELQGETVGLVIGFISQTDAADAYIHFVGVNPKYRQQGIAKQLYRHFFECVTARGCERISSITSPLNRPSMRFHESQGFTAEKWHNYSGPGEDRIVFLLEIPKMVSTTS